MLAVCTLGAVTEFLLDLLAGMGLGPPSVCGAFLPVGHKHCSTWSVGAGFFRQAVVEESVGFIDSRHFIRFFPLIIVNEFKYCLSHQVVLVHPAFWSPLKY